jgi:hypothetical protein
MVALAARVAEPLTACWVLLMGVSPAPAVNCASRNSGSHTCECPLSATVSAKQCRVYSTVDRLTLSATLGVRIEWNLASCSGTMHLLHLWLQHKDVLRRGLQHQTHVIPQPQPAVPYRPVATRPLARLGGRYAHNVCKVGGSTHPGL